MPVIEAQCASILVPHDHRHINQIRALPPLGRARDGTQITLFGMTAVGHLGGHVTDHDGGYARPQPRRHSRSVLGMLIEPCRSVAAQSSRRIVISPGR
jgi:hypothetical protein